VIVDAVAGTHAQPGVTAAEMTIVRLNSRVATDLLFDHLKEQGDIAAEHVGADRLRLSLIGSFNADAMELELTLRLRAWEAAARANGLDVSLSLERDASHGQAYEG
jgi:hypothetical protein